MKKVFILPLFAIAALVSQAEAAYSVCTGAYAGSCKWGSECSAIAIDPGADWSKSDCEEAYNNCKNNGELFSDDACANKVAGGAEACGYFCQWNADCWEIKTNPNGANNEPVTTTCEEAIAKCDKDGQRWTAAPSGGPGEGKQCGGTMIGGNESCGSYCKWPTGCVEIKTDKTGENNEGTPVLSCADAISNCDTNGERYSNASCSGTPLPIFKPIPGMALTVAPFGRSLHIASPKDATISLYDMSGAKVYSGKVRAGNSVFSLEKVSSGSYYAIVQSGSASKKVPVILK
jgi:hypothetical protein